MSYHLGQLDLPIAPRPTEAFKFPLDALRQLFSASKDVPKSAIRPFDRSWVSSNWNEWIFTASQQWDQLEWSARNRLGADDPLYRNFKRDYDAFQRWLSTLDTFDPMWHGDWRVLYRWDERLLANQQEIETKLLDVQGRGFDNSRLIPGDIYASTHAPDFVYRATSIFDATSRSFSAGKRNFLEKHLQILTDSLKHKYAAPVLVGATTLGVMIWILSRSKN